MSTYFTAAEVKQPILQMLFFMLISFFCSPISWAESTFPAKEFGPGIQFGSGLVVEAVATSDLNADGYTDIVIANGGTAASIGIMLGSNGGNFLAPVNYPAGSMVLNVSIGDLNGDSYADLVVPDPLSNNVGVFIGLGDGSFNAVVNYTVGTYPNASAIADLNGDSYADLAVTNYVSKNVSILLGNGDGTFSATVNYPIASINSPPTNLTIADLNGDSYADLEVINQSNLDVFMGLGNGTFAPATPLVLGLNLATSISSGDFNHDSYADIAVGILGVGTGNIDILLSLGDGSFAAPVSYPGTARNISLGDLNGDTYTDLVSGAGVMLGNGDGSFAAPIPYPQLDGSIVSIAELTGDSYADLAVTMANGNRVSVLHGKGDGSFETINLYQLSTSTGAMHPFAVTADLNRDTYSDIITTDQASGNVEILLGLSDGRLGTVSAYPTGLAAPGDVAVDDLNGDGFMDLAIGALSASNISIMLGKGDGTFQPPVTYNSTGTAPGEIEISDLNGDGFSDLITANYNSNNVSVLLGAGDGTFATASTYPSAIWFTDSFIATDLNGDTYTDLALVSQANNFLGIMFGNGDGSFGAGIYPPSGTINTPTILVSGLFNSDIYADIGVLNADGYVSIYLGPMSGSTIPATYYAGTTPDKAIVADINGDTYTDIITNDISGARNTVSILLGTGDGSFKTPEFYAAIPSTSTSGLATADFNHDGSNDLAITYGQNLAILSSKLSLPLGSIDINTGALFTNNSTVLVNLYCNDTLGCSDFRLSNDAISWGTWLKNTATVSWTLSAGSDGPRYVYAQFKNTANRVSSVTSDKIILDTTAPSAPVILTPTPNILTNGAARPVISGTAEANASVTIRDGISILGVVPADSSGAWSLAGGPTLTDGIHSFTATATDPAGNTGVISAATIYKVDTTAPVISLIGSSNIQLSQGTAFTDPGATALDNIDGDISSSISVYGAVNTAVPGVYLLIYTVTDSLNHIGIATRTITVLSGGSLLDTIAPTITLIGSASITLTQGATFTDPGATALDNIDGDLTPSIQISGTVDITTPGAYVLLYTVADTAGNQGVATRVVLINAPAVAPTVISSGGGGCTINPRTQVDPIFILLLLLSGVSGWLRSRRI